MLTTRGNMWVCSRMKILLRFSEEKICEYIDSHYEQHDAEKLLITVRKSFEDATRYSIALSIPPQLRAVPEISGPDSDVTKALQLYDELRRVRAFIVSGMSSASVAEKNLFPEGDVMFDRILERVAGVTAEPPRKKKKGEKQCRTQH